MFANRLPSPPRPRSQGADNIDGDDRCERRASFAQSGYTQAFEDGLKLGYESWIVAYRCPESAGGQLKPCGGMISVRLARLEAQARRKSDMSALASPLRKIEDAMTMIVDTIDSDPAEREAEIARLRRPLTAMF
jgi:hypothetical protein